MIVVVITIIVIVLYRMNKRYNEDKNKIIELENRLNEYYKEREQRLKDKGLIND